MPRYTYTKKLMVFGYAEDGDTVHYVDRDTREQLLAGQITERGILVQGESKPVSLTKFEALAGRYYVKAPTKYTILPSGVSMHEALCEIKGVDPEENMPKEGAAAPRGRKQKREEDPAPVPLASLLLENEHDQFCVYCGNGGEVVELLQCASCPTAMHASCPSVQDIFRAHEAAKAKEEADRTVEESKGGDGAKTKEAGDATATATAGVGMEAAGPSSGNAQTVGHVQHGTETGTEQRDAWYCPACTCCVCGKSVDVMGDQYRGAVHVSGDAEAGPYVDISDPLLFKRLDIKLPPPEVGSSERDASEGVDKGVDGQQWPGKSKSSEIEMVEASGASVDERRAEGTLDETMRQDDLEPPAQPAPDAGTSVVVSASGARAHPSCIEQFPAGLENGEPFDRYCDRNALAALAKVCLRGATNIGSYASDRRVSFQIIHAAAATGRDILGVAPRYTDAQKKSLRKIISAAWVVVKDSYEEIWDSRTGVNLAPMMLQGVSDLPYLDFSGMFIAALFIESSIVSVACFRVLGAVAEMPIVATRRELRGIKAASTLLARLDHELHKIGVKALMTQATYREGPRSFYPYTPSMNPPGAPLPPPGQEVFGFQIAHKEHVNIVVSHGGFIVPGISWVERETGKWDDWSTWSSTLGDIKVDLCQGVDLKSRLALMMINTVPRSKDPAAMVDADTDMASEQEAEAGGTLAATGEAGTNPEVKNETQEQLQQSGSPEAMPMQIDGFDDGDQTDTSALIVKALVDKIVKVVVHGSRTC